MRRVSTMMMMTPYFHFVGGDSLFFKSVAPSSKGALAGAALFLFVLALLERLFASYRTHLDASWSKKYVSCRPASGLDN